MLVEPPRSSQSDQHQDDEDRDNGENGDWRQRPTKPISALEGSTCPTCRALVKHCGDLPVYEEEEGLAVGEA